MTHYLYTDGGSRGNPGPGAIGIVIENSNNEIIYEQSRYIGTCTNNEAEYTALHQGLIAASLKEIQDLECFIDSELVVNQLNGKYKMKNENLKKIYLKIKELQKSFNKISFTHVKRGKNKKADALVNDALDSNGF